MSAYVPIIVSGTLNPDGSLELDNVPPLPPGRVRVTLESLSPVRGAERLPDPPWTTDEIAAPFDLPFPDDSQPISVTQGERLPLPLVDESDL
jgi:hypothetical protein